MAKANVGPIASRITGSVGDTTWRNTRDGLVIQRKPIPTGDPSPAQLKRRAIMRNAMLSWAALDPFIRQDVNHLATLDGRIGSSTWSKWYNHAAQASGQWPWSIASLPDGYVIDSILEQIDLGNAIITLAFDGLPEITVWEVLRHNPNPGMETSGWVSKRTTINPGGHTLTVGGYDGTADLWIVFRHHGTSPNITFARPAFKDVTA